MTLTLMSLKNLVSTHLVERNPNNQYQLLFPIFAAALRTKMEFEAQVNARKRKQGLNCKQKNEKKVVQN